MNKETFKQIEDIICESIPNKSTIVYARVDDDGHVCTITGGNIFDMIRLLAKLINYMSVKSGAPTRLIIKMISDLLEV